MVKNRIQKAAERDLATPRLPENWSMLSATEKARHLVDRNDLPELIENLAADKLYLLISDLGVDSSLELFSHVSSEQWTGVIDLACWEQDAVVPERFAGWLDAAIQSGEEVATRFLAGVDEEYLVVVLKAIAQVEEKDLDKDFVPDSLEIIPSPDGEFFLLIPNGHPMIPFVVQTLKRIFGEDLLRGRRLLRACRAELSSDLSETAFQFRNGRMEDLGFLEREEAVRMFEPIALDTLRNRLLVEDADSFVRYGTLRDHAVSMQLYGSQQKLFLHQVLALLPAGEEKDLLEEHFSYLVNRHCVSTRSELADPVSIQVAALQTYAMVNLGLETLVGKDLAAGMQALQRLWLLELYRAGYTRLLGLQRRARGLYSFTAQFAMFGHPLESMLSALANLVPSAIQGYTEEGEPILRPIATPEEWQQVDATLQYAELVAGVFRDAFGIRVQNLTTDPLPGIPESQREGLNFRQLLLTGLTNQLKGRGFVLTPLDRDAIEGARADFFEMQESRQVLKPGLREMLNTRLEESLDVEKIQLKAFKLFLNQSLDALEETLGKLPKGRPVQVQFLQDLFLTTEPLS